jgi:hypothetical protein
VKEGKDGRGLSVIGMANRREGRGYKGFDSNDVGRATGSDGTMLALVRGVWCLSLSLSLSRLSSPRSDLAWPARLGGGIRRQSLSPPARGRDGVVGFGGIKSRRVVCNGVIRSVQRRA